MPLNQISILVADDDDGDRKLFKRILTKSEINCTIFEATSLDDTIKICQSRKFDCILLDYKMPGKSGLDGVSYLHKMHPYCAIIMVTGQGDEIVASTAIKNGASDYLSKNGLSITKIQNVILNSQEKKELLRKIDKQKQNLELFAQILAHDLSAPLRHMRSYSQLIDTALAQEDYLAAQSYNKNINIAAEHAQRLIQTLEEYNKATEENIPFSSCSLQEVLEEVLLNLASTITDKNADINIGTLPQVFGNKTLLIQLFQNLISNSLKYCDAVHPVISITQDETKDSPCITVSDNGIGIPEKDQFIIFEPFRRLHSKGQYPGTGLGLATCQKIMNRHRGKIWCQSQDPKGTVFFLKFPGGHNGT